MSSKAERDRRRRARTAAAASAARAGAAPAKTPKESSSRTAGRAGPGGREDGLDMLLARGRISRPQADTGRWYGMLWRTAQISSGPVRVVDLLSSGGAGTGEGGRPAADDAAWIADCRGELAAARAALLGHEALIGVLDLVCGGGQRPREISTDQRESEQLETALRLGLDMLGRHRAARRALARII